MNAAELAAGELDCRMAASSPIVAAFERNGYFVLRGALPGADVDAFWAEFEMLRKSDPLLQYAEYGQVYRGDDPSIALRKRELRAINTHSRSPRARSLAMHGGILPTIQALVGQPVGCIQTLCYSVSSRQGAHSDKFLVSPAYVGSYDRDTLVAAWIACEDADEANGGLVVYPGSHRLAKKTVFDLDGDYGRYVAHLEALCRDAGIRPRSFRARKGDVLIWHGDFVHAGGIPEAPDRSRASLVCHYASASVRTVLSQGGTVWRVGSGCVFGGADS